MINLYVDVTTGNLLSAQNQNALLNPLTLPFCAGDTGLVLNVYLFEPLADILPGQFNYTNIGTANSAGILVQIDNGVNAAAPFTSQSVWTADPTGSFWTAILPMNTAGLNNLVAGIVSGMAYLRIAYYPNGAQTTLSPQRIQIYQGIPGVPVQFPIGLTPLSLQQAEAMFVPINGGVDGQGYFLISQAGKKIYISAVDNLADGTASVQESPSN